MRRFFVLPAVLGVVLSGTPSFTSAGTLCGTVRDAGTQAPIERAGVFLFLPDGTYTGLHAATDAAGGFCLDAVPAGTYDLQARVDDYLAAVIYGVVVTDAVTGVEVPALPPTLRLLPPRPNPARSRVHLAFSAEPGAQVELLVVDLRGRVVRAFGGGVDAGASSSPDNGLTWDFRDRQGRRVPGGVYFVLLTDGVRTQTRRLTFLP
jgi:hypothetical protein